MQLINFFKLFSMYYVLYETNQHHRIIYQCLLNKLNLLAVLCFKMRDNLVYF